MSADAPAATDPGAHRWTMVTATLLVLAALPSFVNRLLLATQRIPLNYNEGWNALHADRLRQGLALYPPPGGPIANNYPPLSFHLVALLGGEGDLIPVLRLLSLLGLAATIALSGATVAFVGRSRLAGGLTAALLFATFAIPFREYVAMADPALLAHGFLAMAMYIAARWWESDRMLRWALVFQLLAGLTKHNLVALPVAMALALLLDSRARGLILIALGVPMGGAAIALLRYGYGADALHSILASRQIQLATATAKLRNFLPPIVLPMVAGLVGGVLTLTRPVERMFLLYLVLSVALASFFAAGAGTNVNIFFDAAIASAVLCGLLVARLNATSHPRWMAYAPLVLGLSLVLPAKASWQEAREQQLEGGMARRVAETADDLRLMTSTPGPVACEILALCYWAGKGFELDFFNANQALVTGRAGPENLRTRLNSGRYAMVQLVRVTKTRFRLADTDTLGLVARYETVRTSSNGVLLVPRRR